MSKIQNLVRYIRFILYSLLSFSRIKAAGRNFFSRGQLTVKSNGQISLGSENVVDKNFDWEVKEGRLNIGSRNYFNKNVKIVCFESIQIGDDCLIADSAHMYDHDHRHDDLHRPVSQQGYVTAPVKIGNRVWIGAKVTVLKGVTIGDGVIVGANSLVSRDLPANSICGGVPAKVIKMRQ